MLNGSYEYVYLSVIGAGSFRLCVSAPIQYTLNEQNSAFQTVIRIDEHTPNFP